MTRSRAHRPLELRGRGGPGDRAGCLGRRARMVLRVVTICAALGGSARAGPTDGVAGPLRPGPADDLVELCRSLEASENPYYGRATRRRLEAELAADDLAAEDRVLRLVRLAREQLQEGDARNAIASVEEALQRMETLGVGPDARAPVLEVLGLAWLQAAENEACREGGHAARCLLPLRPEGRPSSPEAARRAAAAFGALLELRPGDVRSAWLLRLALDLAGEVERIPPSLRLPAAALGTADFPRWVDRGPELGLAAMDVAGGAVLDDFDGDGRLDLVSSTADPCDHAKAWRNDGRGGFEEVAAAWGLAGQLGGLNLVHGDPDGDGRLDLLILRGAWLFEDGHQRVSLLRNRIAEGAGFEDVTVAAGLAEPVGPSQTAAFADYDLDGDLDLYQGVESRAEQPLASRLWRNRGDGTFEDVGGPAGVANLRYAKGVAWGDFDDDGDEDLYVSNFGPNRLYRNRGDGTFADVAPELGITEPEGRSFACWWFDVDNDGDLDLFVADYAGPPEKVVAGLYGVAAPGGHPRLYRNDAGTFRDASAGFGLTAPQLPMGANFGDLDDDGFPDVYLGTGDPQLQSILPNVMLRNVGGVSFEPVTGPGGFGHLQKGHGVAFGDVDGDGDQDLFHQLGGFFRGDAFANALFENPGTPGRSVVLRLEGAGRNRFAVGARVAVATPEGRTIHHLVGSGGSFGGNSLQAEIGLGATAGPLTVRVRWPGGAVAEWGGIPPDRIVVLRQGEPVARVIPFDPAPLGGRGVEGSGAEDVGARQGRRDPRSGPDLGGAQRAAAADDAPE